MKKSFTLILSFAFIAQVFAQDTTKAKKPEFKPSGKLWGHVFGDCYFKVHTDSMGRGSAQYSGLETKANGFDLRRIYLGYDYNISENFSSELLVAHEGQVEPGGNRTVYVKAANVKWKNFLHNTDLIFGLQSTPTFALITDKVWGYRSVEKSLSDFRGVSKAVDAGIGLQGRFDSTGNFGYNLLLANGSGAKIEADKFKKFYGDVYLKLADKKVIIDFYGDYETVQLSPYFKNKWTFKMFLGYQTEDFTIGIEGYRQMQQNAIIYTDYSDTSGGVIDTGNVSVFGAGIFVRGTIRKDKLSFFLRADSYDPNTMFSKFFGYAPSYTALNTERFFTVGLDYSPAKNIHVIPNIWLNSYHSKLDNATKLAKSDMDLVPRLTFYYVFK